MTLVVRSSVFTTTENDHFTAKWTGLDADDAGTAVTPPSCDIITCQLLGTLSTGGAVTMQGSMDGTTWGTLHTAGGTDCVLNSLGQILAIVESPLYVRPLSTGGDGSTSMTVIISSATR